MSTVTPDGPRAKILGQDELVEPGSDLALCGVFMEIVRARFRGQNVGLPWIWTDDPRPDPDETNQASSEPGAPGTPPKPRRLTVETDLLDDPEARSGRPAVFVGVEESVYNKFVIGDRYGVHREDRFEAYTALVINSMKIDVVATKRGESSVLANIVWRHLMATKNIVRATFSIHEIGDFKKGKTQPYRRDPNHQDAYTTPILFNVAIEERWFTRPNAPLIQEIMVRFNAAGNGDPLQGAVTLALYNGQTK